MDNNIGWIGIGIDILPTEPFYSQIVGLNKELVKYGSNYKIELIPPHINLYDIDIPTKNFEEVDRKLKEISDLHNSFEISCSRVDYFKHGSIYVACDINESLKNFQQDIVKNISNLRENIKTKEYWESWREYTENQLENRENYGNPNVLNFFEPHVTVGFIKDPIMLKEANTKLNELLKPTVYSVRHFNLVIKNSENETIKTIGYKLNTQLV